MTDKFTTIVPGNAGDMEAFNAFVEHYKFLEEENRVLRAEVKLLATILKEKKTPKPVVSWKDYK